MTSPHRICSRAQALAQRAPITGVGCVHHPHGSAMCCALRDTVFSDQGG